MWVLTRKEYYPDVRQNERVAANAHIPTQPAEQQNEEREKHTHTHTQLLITFASGCNE